MCISKCFCNKTLLISVYPLNFNKTDEKIILHNAEYARSILNVIDYRSEKLVLKLFERFSDQFPAIKSQKCSKRHYVGFAFFSGLL